MKLKAVAIGIGVEWGHGTLSMYDGPSHEFKIIIILILIVLFLLIQATGEVYHLVEAKDLAGTFFAGEAGAVLVAGGSALDMKNGNGVIVKLKSTQKGARLTQAAEGLKIKMK